MIADDLETDVVVVGAGSAAACAALSAREHGAQVLMLEAAPQDQRGGNSAYTGGKIRVVYHGVDDIRQLVPDLTEAELAICDLDTYYHNAGFGGLMSGAVFGRIAGREAAGFAKTRVN